MAQVQGTKEQILISAYNSGVEYIHNYQKNNADFYNELVKRFEDEKLAMQILGFSPVGWLYYLGKGIYNGVVGFGEGAVVTLTNFINNVVQVFKSDEQFGSDAWFGELSGDINYLFVSGIVDAIQGIENATLNFLGNAGGMFGASTEWSENLKKHSNKAFYDFKVGLLEKGDKRYFGDTDWLPSDSPDRPENHILPFASDIISRVDDIASKMYWKDDIFAPYMQDNEVMSKAHQLYSGVLESVGRMIPSIALTYLSGGSSIGILASSSYFYATTYGQSFNEAIEKGVSIYDANQYATQIAMVETMTEQIGGFQFGSGIGSNIAESVLNEGMEEFIAEMATSQVTYDEEGKPIYESQEDLIERVIMATVSGAISGGLMTGGQIFGTKVYRGEVGKTADNLAKSVSLSIKQNGLDKVQSAVTNALDDVIESLNKTVNNEQSRKKSEKIISETEAQKYIEYSEKEKKFVLTDLGKEIHSDIRAHQGKTAMTDNHTVRVNPTIQIKEEISVERIENGKKIIVKEKIKILEKNNPKYQKNKKSVDDILNISEELGINVVLYEGDVSNAQGFYVDGVSYVNINALGKDGLGLQKQIYGHELLHQLFERFRQNVLTKKADKKLLKLSKDIFKAVKTNKEFVKEVGLKTADIKDLATLREEHLAYFIEKYVSMDLVMESLAYRRPDLMKNIVDDMTSIRAKREMTVIEKEYMELLAEINLHTMDSISATLALSNLTPENAKASKIVQRKMYNKTKSEYDYLVNYLIKVDKNGEYIVPDELKEDFKGKSDKDVKFHPDFKEFLVAFKNRDEKAIIDNFLNTKNIEDETLQKRLTAYKAVQIFEYMESNKFYRHNEVMEAFKADFVAEINSRIEAKKATLKDFPVHDGNLIKVDAETFHEVFALNYLKMWRENYVSLFPISTYKNVKYLYLRDDLMAGFAVQGEETNDNADFGRYELASLFRSEGEAGWLKGKVDFIVKDLQARQLASVSEKHARRYKEIFEGSLQIIRNSMIIDEEKPMRFKNFGYSMLYMSNDWTALYSNYIITELALRKDNPTYKVAHQTGLRRRITTPIKYSKANVLVTDSVGNELTQEQQDYFKDSVVRDENGNLKVVYHGTKADFNTFLHQYISDSTGSMDFGYGFYFTDSEEVASGYGTTKSVYLDIKKPLSYDTKTITKADLSKLLKTLDADGEMGILSNFDDVSYIGYAKLLSKATNMLYDNNTNDVDIISEMINIHGGYRASKEFYNILKDTLGYDGIITKYHTKKDDVYVVFNSNQIKSVDNKTPTYSDDIRYSRTIDSEGRELTPEQQEFFKDSKFRNKKGNLLSLYHGSNSAGFMQFNEDKPIFLTDDFEHSITYTRGSRDVITQKFNTLESLEDFIVSDDFAEYFPFFEDNQDGRPTFAKIKNTPEKSYMDEYANTIINDFIKDRVKKYGSSYESKIRQAIEQGKENLYIAKFSFNINNETHTDYALFSNEAQLLDGLLPFFQSSYNYYLNEYDQLYEEQNNATNIYSLYAKVKNPLIIDAKNGSFGKIKFRDKLMNTDEISQIIKEEKEYDGIIFERIKDSGFRDISRQQEINTVYVVFNSNQLKAIDNETPTDISDIRYSRQDYTIRSQFDYFQDTLLKDKNGSIVPMLLLSDIVKSRPTYYAKSLGVVKSGYFLFSTDVDVKKYKKDTKLVFANITKALNADVKITSAMYENIIKNAVKEVKTLDQDIIDRYRLKIISGEINNFSQIVDMMSFSLSGYEDLYNFKRAIFEATGYDGFISYDENGNIVNAVAWFDEQIKSVDNLALDDNQKDTILFSKYSDDIVDDLEEVSLGDIRVEIDIEKLLENGWLETVTDKSLLEKGYMFQIPKSNFYIHERHLKIPFPFEKNNIFYGSVENEIVLSLKNLKTNKYFDLSIPQDYIHPTTKKIYKNARYLASGMSYHWFSKIPIETGSISQSVALEDLSNRIPEASSYSSAKPGQHFPEIFVVMKKDILNKTETISGSIDYFTKVRKIYGDKIMLFDDFGNANKEQFREMVKKEALSEIEKNKGVISEKIEQTYNIYDENDPLIVEKINNATNNYLKKQMVSKIADFVSSYNKSSYTNQYRMLSILRDLVFFGKTNLNFVSDANRTFDFISEIDKYSNMMSYLANRYGNIEIMAQNIFDAKAKSTDEYNMKEYLLKLPYTYNGNFAEVRELKTNINYSDIATIYYKYGDRDAFAMEQDLYDYDAHQVMEGNDTYGVIRQFDNAVNEIEKTLSSLGEKEIRTIELGDEEDIREQFIKDINNGDLDPETILFSKQDISENIYENGLVDNNSNDFIDNAVLFSRKFVKVKSGNTKSALNNLHSQKMETFDRKTYENIERVYADFLLTYKEDKKTTGGKVIAKIVENIEKRIRNNNNREQIFNHLYNTVAKTLVLQLNILNSDTTTKTTDAQREILVSSINSTIAQTMSYLDTVFTNNDVNKLDPSNTQGNQYTRLIYHYLRAVLDNNNQTHEGSEKITSLYEALFDLDITSKISLEGLYDALKEFEKATNVDQVSSCVVATGGEYAYTLKNAERQADIWIDSALDIVGKYMTVYDKLGKRSTKRSGGLIGKNSFLDDLGIANWIADPFTYAEIASLFLPNALPQVIQNRLFEGSKKQLKVLNHFHTFFEEGGWAKHNQKNINDLEKKYIKINNLLDYNGNPMDISLSQVITLYNTLKRELIRNKMIDEQFIKGEKTHHFENGNRILATENVSNKIEREAKGRYGKIVDNIGLLNDLSEILHQPENSFALEYNKKIMSFFEAMYPYVNATFKDINGLELPNDAVVIKKAFDSMSAEEKSELLKGFPTVEDFSQIYIPYRNARGSYSGKNTFDVNNILDLGVFDGLAQALTNSSSELVIDSINNLMPEYAKEVANYYGLYRIARDLNEMFGTQEQVPGTIQETNLAQKMVLLSPNIVKYYEELLKDIAGYSTQKDTTSQKFDKFMAKLRKNYFRASLALNVKVIATQFASMITCGTIFGKGSNPLTNAGFMARFMKNLFTAGSKTRAKYLVENSEIYKNRARLSTYEVSEATEKTWTKNPVENAIEFLMSGITLTDNMINRALFVTLVEDGYSEQEAMEKVELAISRYQSSGNAIDRAELLRTENQVLRLFTKFLGEPMKMLTNFYGISKKLNIINKYEKNKDEINKHFDNKKIDEDKKLIVKKEEMRLRYEYEASPAFQELSEKDKRKYTAETQKKQSAYNALEYEVDRAKRMYDIVKSNVQEVINSKAETKEKLGRLVSAFAGSLLWQVLLGVAFKMLRGGAKDKPEDEEMRTYIGKMFGFQLATELVGYLPFVRDVYTVVINGYSGHEIDELQPFNDLFLQMNYLISDIVNGGDFNAGRHIRQFSISLGSILGIPVRNIERLFTTPMSWFSQSSSFTYKSATGQRVDVNQELTNAIANQDEKLIEAVIAQKLNSRNIMLGQDVIDEVERLASVNGEMITISGDYGKFTVDGKEYVLTREQQEKFTEIYSRADYIASKIIKSAEYKQLSDEYKAKFLTSIFNYFYKMAKQEISGIEQISEKNYFTNLVDAYDYFITAVAKRLYNTMINEQEKKEA